MHDLPDAQPGDGDSLGNCMQTKLTADSNVSGDTNVSTIKTDAVLIKPTTIDTDAMSAKPVGGTLAMLTNVDTLKEELGPSTEKKPGPSKEKDAPIHFVTRHKAFNGSMRGPRYAMLVHLAITLFTVHGWVLPSDDKVSSLSSHAITGGVDGARARRQLIASGCSGSWSVCPPTRSLLPI